MKISRSTYISMFFNSFIPGSKPYEMLSSHAYRSNNKTAIAVLDWIFGEGHCEECYEWELDNVYEVQH